MILFPCSCGAAHAVDDEYAGGSMSCDKCNSEIVIPDASDPGVALVYKAGESENGVPMAWTDVTARIEAGELETTDLVWHGNTWVPIGDVMGAQAEGDDGGPPDPTGAKSKLRLKKDAEADEAAVEGLDPVEGAAEEGKSEEGGGGGGFLAKLLPFGKKKDDDGFEVDEEDSKKKKIMYAVQGVVILIVVYFGYICGIGPLLSHHSEKPTYVIVQNHEDVEYVAKLGWRRLKQELFKKAYCRFELYVGPPFLGIAERQTLTITPKQKGAGEGCKLKITLRPDAKILVNLKKKGKYGVFDLAKAKGQKIDDSLGRLLKAISNNEAPTAAMAVTRSARKIAKSTFVETREDLMYTAEQYQLARIWLLGMGAGKQQKKDAKGKDKKKEEKKKPEKPKKPKPLPPYMIVHPPNYRIDFTGGSCWYYHDDPNKIEMAIHLPLKTIELTDSRTLKVKNLGQLTMRGDADKLTMSVQMTSHTVKAEGMTFSGNWAYNATGDREKGWRWSWVFRGHSSKKGVPYAINVRVDKDGKETLKVGEVIR